MRNDIKPLTSLRGIAAVYVVLYHSWQIKGTALTHGYIAVDLFFVLSGFVIALTYQDMFVDGIDKSGYLAFLIRRLGRIYPLYIATTILAAVAMVLNLSPYPEGHSLRFTFICNLLMIQSWGVSGSINYPSWSISTEWFAYLLFPILVLLLLRTSETKAHMIFGICVGCLIWVASSRTPANLGGHRSGPLDCSWNILPVVRCTSEFAIGMLAFRASQYSSVRDWAAHWMTTPALVAATIALLFVPRSDLLIVALIPPLILALTFGSGKIQNLLSMSLIVLLGDLSYAIYLLHPLALIIGNTEIQAVIRHVFLMFPPAAVRILNQIPVKCEMWVILLSASWLVHVWFEVPMRNASRSLVPRSSIRPLTSYPVPTH